MASGFRVVFNHIPRVRAGAETAVSKAVTDALRAGEKEAKARLTPGHGVDTGAMKAGIHANKTGAKSGELVNPAFYARYVENGTTFMAAIPHMRPAARKMGSELRKELKANLGKVR